jgi:dolichol-phosphate mannosyltransferase
MINESQKILVAVPTLNERKNIEILLKEIRASLPRAEIIVIDDNSQDGTAECVVQFSESDSLVSVISRPTRLGVGSAHKRAFVEASLRAVDVLVTLDADLTHDPKDISKLLELLDSADVVVGSRFLPQGGLEDWTFLRRALTHTGHLATRLILGVPFDATGSLRVYRVSKVFPHLESFELGNGYTWFYESLAVLHHQNVKIGEVPIILNARTYGSSKMTTQDVFFGAVNMFKFRLKTIRGLKRRRSNKGEHVV